MAREVCTGAMSINAYDGADGTLSIGGRKQTGNSSDKPLRALEKFANQKSMDQVVIAVETKV